MKFFFIYRQLCKMYEEYLDDWFNYSIHLIAKTVKKAVTGTDKKLKNQSKKDEEGKEVNENTNSENVPESATLQRIRKESHESKEIDLLSAIHFHTSVFLIWLLTSLLYIPSLLMWAKNYHYSIFLENDPSVIPSIIVNGCGAILWQAKVPKKNRSVKIIKIILNMTISKGALYSFTFKIAVKKLILNYKLICFYSFLDFLKSHQDFYFYSLSLV